MSSKTETQTNKNIDFIFCSFFPVGLEDYAQFFAEYFDDFKYLKWKFPHSKDKNAYSVLETYKDGKLAKSKKLYSFSRAGTELYFLLLPFNYLIYLFQALALIFVPREKGKKVVFMGINYYCTFCGILLKKLGRVDYVIYRVMDFFPLPDSGPYRLLTKIFYQFDKFCLTRSDFLWFTTEGHILGREKYGYFDRKKVNYEMIPLGINMDKVVVATPDEKNSHAIVYCGVVNRYHLLDLVFEAVEKLKKTFPDLVFNVIGDGPDLNYYKELSNTKKLGKSVVFHGYMEENEKFYKTISENSLGIALYRDEENLMKYTEPAKVKYYLNFGIPAIISKVPQIAFELDKREVSFAVDNTIESIAGVIKKYFSDPKMRQKYRSNLLNYIKEVDVKMLLRDRFEKLENSIK
ncbi:MAG: glycosyltransferase [Candidatus Berkelbacteria bacterium]|nr:glycosyltransferase [Candidatus Berkelbacteria bacterium]